MEARSLDHCCHGETIRITYSECVFVALDMHKRVLVLYCHMWPVRLHNIFRLYVINGTIFRKKVSELQMRVLFSIQFLSETFLILRRIQLYIMNVYWYSCKVPLLLLYFKETWILSTEFRKIIKYYNFMKVVQWEPRCSMRTIIPNIRYSQFHERVYKQIS